ncbi:hypothetical protein AAFF_G00341580 [Aldrovandia affinis]|uniref:Uncharacterized protein n=1 Tax=Aldrovandia affinis TaxID=143900 RepID=A0AAD7WPM8_9TELE|nr:hypothetical protein AAFF_G00341580 [Aldrovandia affinis]
MTRAVTSARQRCDPGHESIHCGQGPTSGLARALAAVSHRRAVSGAVDGTVFYIDSPAILEVAKSTCPPPAAGCAVASEPHYNAGAAKLDKRDLFL